MATTGSPEPAPSAEFLDLVLSCVPAFVVASDTDLRFTAIRGTILEAIGVGPAQIAGLIGTPMRAYFSGPDGDRIMTRAQASLTGADSSFEAEWQGRWFMAHIGPLRDASGAIIGSVGVGMDITRRHDLEQALEAERMALTEAQQLAELGSWELDMRTGTVRISPGAVPSARNSAHQRTAL